MRRKLLESQFSGEFINPSCTKPFGTHPLNQGGSPGPPAISKTVAPMNLKFCRVLETSFDVLEMLKLFTECLLGYHSNSSKERCFIGKPLDFSRKYRYSSCYQIHSLQENIKLFLRIALLLVISIIYFMWVGKPDFGKGQVESRVETGKNCHFSREVRDNFVLEG